MGQLKLDPEMVKRLGMQGLTERQCKVATAMWVSKPVVPTEAALLALELPIVQRSRGVDFFNTAPPTVRTRTVLRGGTVCASPVDLYIARPPEMEGLCLKR